MFCKYKIQITDVILKNQYIFKNAVALRIEMTSFFFSEKDIMESLTLFLYFKK